MTDYRALASYAPATSFTPSGPWSLGHEFSVTSSGMSVRGIWYYRGSSACTATPTAAVYAVDSTGLTGPMVPYTYIAFPTSTVGAWTYQALPNPVPIAANTPYRVVVFTGATAFYYTNNFWVSPGAGASGLTNGPLVMPNGVNATGFTTGHPMQGQSMATSGGTGANPGSIQFTGGYSTSQLWPVDVTVTDVSYPNPVEINPHVSGNTSWQNSLATPITAQALENFESFSDSDHPFAGFRTNHMRIAKNENYLVPPTTEVTLLDTQGPGVVRYIWFATGGNVASLDCRLRIYYDGSTTPAMDQDLGTLYAMHWAGTQQVGVPANQFNNTNYYSSVSTPHMHAEEANSFNCAYTMKFPIPFGNRIRIAYYNPNATTSADMYSMIYYHYTNSDQANGIRLRCQGTRYADQLTAYTSAQAVALANITTGPGWVVWLSQVGGINATNGSWMERNLVVQLDGETIQGASMITTGTEDTFDSAWYFEGWHMFNCGPDSWVGADYPGATSSSTQYTVGMATEYLGKLGGIYFNNSCVMSFQPEPACTMGDSRVWCVLYYN
jgi:hypothetical protein